MLPKRLPLKDERRRKEEDCQLTCPITKKKIIYKINIIRQVRKLNQIVAATLYFLLVN